MGDRKDERFAVVTNRCVGERIGVLLVTAQSYVAENVQNCRLVS